MSFQELKAAYQHKERKEDEFMEIMKFSEENFKKVASGQWWNLNLSENLHLNCEIISHRLTCHIDACTSLHEEIEIKSRNFDEVQKIIIDFVNQHYKKIKEDLIKTVKGA